MKRVAALALLTAFGCGEGSGVLEVGIEDSGTDEPVDSGPPRAGRGGDTDAGGTAGTSSVPPDAGGMAGTRSIPPPPDPDADAGGPMIDPNAPVVEILTPIAADDPNDDEVIVDNMVLVRCLVTKSTRPGAGEVNESSVTISMLNPNNPADVTTMSADFSGADEYEAVFLVSQRPNGRVRFVCEASDVGMPPSIGRATVDTFLDLGPVVEITRPLDESNHALTSPVLVRFEVRESPLGGSDEEAAVNDVTLLVSGVRFTATPDPNNPKVYTASIPFDDGSIFPGRPTNAEIVVTAASSRTPEAPTRRAEVNIDLDSEGPTITINEPVGGTIQRGNVTLSVAVTDLSMILEGSVIATISGIINGENGEQVIDSWNIAGDVYTEDFDTRAFDSTATQLTINVTASDTVGNQVANPVSTVIRLDNVPPIASLDPPELREMYFEGMGQTRTQICSLPFDPLGWAVSDGEIIPDSAVFRMLVHERTNGSRGQLVRYHAGVDETSAFLYAQDDLTVPLVIDTNGDGKCDEINSAPPPPGEEPTALRLNPVPPAGAAYYAASATFDAALFPDCTAGGAMEPPAYLCPTTAVGLTRAMAQTLEGGPFPAVYAFMPQPATPLACAGNSWEVLGSVGNGWSCFAGRVEDRIGNVAVTRPMRACVDNGIGPSPCLDPPPTCTDGCAILPDEFAENDLWERK